MKRNIFFAFALLAAGTVFAAGTSGGSSGGSSGGATSMTRSPSSASDWYSLGYSAANAGKYEEAVTDFQKAISLKSDYAEAYNMLGFCARKMGNVNGAFVYYETALKLKPNFPEAREYYGEAYLQEGNLASAVQQYIILEKGHNKNAGELLERIEEFVNKKS